MKFLAKIQDQEIRFELGTGNGSLKALSEHFKGSLDLQLIYPGGVYSLILNHRSQIITVRNNDELNVQVDGVTTPVTLLDEMALQLEAMGWENVNEKRVGHIIAQIPGLVTHIFKSVGDAVTEGDPLLIMEAMKMENELKAPTSGILQALHIKTGETVDKGQLILEIV